ncbi:MAG: PH domain-containing protein [Planctomycetota bacterium]
MLLPGSTYLRITEEGLTISNLFRKRLFPWDVIDEFRVVELKRRGVNVGKIVGFNFVQSYDRFAAGRRLARAINQCEVALPDDYGMKVEELAELLNSKLQEYRETNAQPIARPDDGEGAASG